MEGSDLIALMGVCLIVAAAVFAILANVAINDGKARLRKLERELAERRIELEDRRKIRDRNEALMNGAKETVRDLELALEAAKAELKEMEAREPTRIHVLSRKAEGSAPIYIAPVTAGSGFPDGEPDGAAQERIYAGPAVDEAAFRRELDQRFPAERGFSIGAITLFSPPDTLASAVSRQVA